MALQSVHIGINDYPGTDMDLHGCVNDAKDWEKAIRARGGMPLHTLHDADATKANIVAAITRLLAVTRADDVGVITYSGHGTFVPDLDGDEVDGHDEAWCPWDLEDGLLLDDEINELFMRHKQVGAKIIILSDSCFSGTVSRFFITPSSSVSDRRARFMPPFNLPQYKRTSRFVRRQIELLARTARPGSKPVPGVVLISGCSDKEYSYDAVINNRPNGAFTAAATAALAKAKAGATYASWFAAIRKALPSQQFPQTPQLTLPPDAKTWRLFA